MQEKHENIYEHGASQDFQRENMIIKEKKLLVKICDEQ